MGGILLIVFTLPPPPFFRSDSEDEDNISTQAIVGEAVHGVGGREGGGKDVLGHLSKFCNFEFWL